MFRVRLASGEEVLFQSVEELAQGIRSGEISASALLFHTKGNRWVPITVHPEYSAALERNAAVATTEEIRQAEPAQPATELAPGNAVPVYQMVSVSARELAARRRPRWILPGTGAISFLVFLMTVALVFQPGSEAIQNVLDGRNPLRGAPAKPVRTTEPDTNALDAPGRPIDPPLLAARMARSGRALSTVFLDSMAALGLEGLLAPHRLAVPESVAAIRLKLEQFRALRAAFLQDAAAMERAYEDSAARFASSGQWARVELVEWHARVVELEDAKGAARTEEVLTSLDSLYRLLDDEQGRVLFSNGQARFLRAAAGAQYDRLRTVLMDYGSLPGGGERLPVPLAALLRALGAEPLPQRAT